MISTSPTRGRFIPRKLSESRELGVSRSKRTLLALRQGALSTASSLLASWRRSQPRAAVRSCSNRRFDRDERCALSHGELVDLKYPIERALAVIPDLVIGLSSRGDTTGDTLEDLATVVTALQIVQSNLDLDSVDDDDDNADDPQAMNTSRWKGAAWFPPPRTRSSRG